MDEEIKKQKEKEQYKYKKTKPTFKTTTEFDENGEIFKETTETKQGTRREKGTFYQGDPEELIRFIQEFGKKQNNMSKIFEYIISNINYANEFSFDKKWLNTNFPKDNIKNFYNYIRKLEKNKWIFKTTKKNVYTLNVQFFNRMTPKKAFDLYKEQFNEDFDKDINTYMYMSKMAQKLNKEQIKSLIKQLENHLKNE